MGRKILTEPSCWGPRRGDLPRGKDGKKRGRHIHNACTCSMHMQWLRWRYTSKVDGLTEDGGQGAATEPMTKQGKIWRSCPSVFGCSRVFVRSTSWEKKKKAWWLKPACYHMLDSQMGRCWVLSECLYGFWHLGLNQSKHCHSNLDFHEHLCTFPLVWTACTGKGKKMGFLKQLSCVTLGGSHQTSSCFDSNLNERWLAISSPSM